MFAKNTKRNSLTLSQSNTGLCNISNTTSPSHVDERKSRKNKTKQHERMSKKQQYITNNRINNKPFPAFRKRSQSGPRLSSAKLCQIENEEISAKQKRKTEFIANREKRNSLERTSLNSTENIATFKPPNLRHIKENKQSKPSKKRKLFKNKKPFATLSLETITSSSKKIKKKQKPKAKPQSVSAITVSKRMRHKKNKKRFKKQPKRPRNHSNPTRHLDQSEKPSYKYRGRGHSIGSRTKCSKHLHSESQQINLNSVNEIFRTQRSKSFSSTTTNSYTPTPSIPLRNISMPDTETVHVSTSTFRAKKKAKKKKIRLQKNDRYIMYNRYTSQTQSQSPTVSPSLSHLSPSVKLIYDDRDSDYLSVSSYYSSSTASPNIKRDKFDTCQKPNIRIVYSPRINEAVFMGNKADGQPCYKFRGRGKLSDDDDEIDAQLTESQTAAVHPPKFTFEHIKAKYKPHRIKWSTKTGFTDSEFSEFDEEPMFTFSDNSSDSQSLSDSDSDCDYAVYDNHDNHARAKTMKINMLLSDLLSDSDSFGDGDENNNFTIVIDEMGQDKQGNEIYFGSVEASEDEQFTPTENENLQLFLSKTSMTQSPPSQDDIAHDGELLFDFTSFVANLSNKRLQLNK